MKNLEGFTFVALLKACTKRKDVQKGIRLHDEILRRGLLDRKNPYVASALINMYSKCGMLEKAKYVLGKLPVRDIVSWNALMSGYAHHKQFHEVLQCFDRMQKECLSPDVVSFICILKACGSTRNIEKGKQIHDVVVNSGLLEKHVELGNVLVDMYAKCGMLEKAKQVLEELHIRNVVSWSSLIGGYVQQGQGEEALSCFERMQSEGCPPDAITFSSILKACAITAAICKGRIIHEKIVSRGLLEKDIVLGTSLVDMYAKCGMLAKAQKVLKELHIKNVVSWNALIAGYAQQGQGHEALNCFEHMQSKGGPSPDAVTFTCALKACGSIGAIDKGKHIHDEILHRGLLERDTMLGNALVDMYAKCGVLAKAQQVIEELPVRNVVSWNALISGHAQGGQGHEALNCLKYMQSDGLSPDEVTFQCVLRACTHAGLLDEAQLMFANICRNNTIIPSIEHHSCVLVVLGCAGYFDEVLSVTKVMPFSDHPIVWLAVLNACRKWGNVKLAKFAFNQIVEFNHNCAAAHVLISDIFAAAGMKEEVKKIESMKLKHE